MKRIIASSLCVAILVGWLGLTGIGSQPISSPASPPEEAKAEAVYQPIATSPAATSGAEQSDAQAVSLFFVGKRRSRIEPCGCKTKQRGGIQYEARLYADRAGLPAVRLDAGEWTRMRIERAPLDALQTRYLLRAFGLLGFDAVNVSLIDLQFSETFFSKLEEEAPGTTDVLVSANVFDKSEPQRHAFNSYKIVTRTLADGAQIKIGITGATTLNLSSRENKEIHETDSYVARPAVEALKPVIEELRPQVDLVVVLFAGRTDELLLLADTFPDIDCLVTTATLPDRQAMAHRHGNVLLLKVPGSQGKELGFVTLHREGGGRWEASQLPESLFVSLDLKPDQDLLALINDFTTRTQNLDVKLPGKGVRDIYAGANRCVSCHKDIYTEWRSTGHAQAMQRLVDVAQQFNPECVRCHVTGYQEENGFYSVKHAPSMNFIGVQCESCHGPSKRHVTLQHQIRAGVKNWKSEEEYQSILKLAEEAMPAKAVPAGACVQCHDAVNDPDFKYEATIGEVDHGALMSPENMPPPAKP